MNKVVIGVLGFVVGAAAGGTGVYLYCKQATEKIVEDECEKIRDYYKRNSQKIEVEVESIPVSNVDMAVSEIDKPQKYSGKRSTDPEDIVRYDRCFVGGGSGDNSSENVEKISKKPTKIAENEAKMVQNGLNLEKIRQIGDDEWSDWDGYDSKILSYFEDEEVFLDENYEEVIGAIDSVGGVDMLDGAVSTDGCIYIKNENEHCKYEIIVETCSYKEYRKRYGLDEE